MYVVAGDCELDLERLLQPPTACLHVLIKNHQQKQLCLELPYSHAKLFLAVRNKRIVPPS